MRPILGLILSVLLCSTFARAGDPPSLLESSPGGWTDLLANAGPGLKGWTRLAVTPGGKLKSETTSQWSLDPDTGILVCEGNGGHEWLRYDQEIGDAIYHVEWRFTPVAGKKGYNSGIYARNSADARVWHQAQTGDGSGGFLFGDSPVNGEIKRFNLAGQVKNKHVVKPAGAWNTFEITCKGKTLALRVNGEDTVKFEGCEVPRGYLGLEAEGYRIEFKNVKIKAIE